MGCDYYIRTVLKVDYNDTENVEKSDIIDYKRERGYYLSTLDKDSDSDSFIDRDCEIERIRKQYEKSRIIFENGSWCITSIYKQNLYLKVIEEDCKQFDPPNPSMSQLVRLERSTFIDYIY